MPSANKKISWFQNADLLPFSTFPAELRGAQSPPSLSPQASLWGCHKGQARTLLQFILSCLVKEMTPRRAVHALFLNYPRFYNFNSLPFKWAEKWMWSLLYPPCTPRLQHNSVFWVHFPPRLSFGARFGRHGTGTVQPAISLSLLYLFSFISRNEWHQNVLNSQILSRVTRPKMKMGIPLVCYQVILLPQRAHRPCKGSAHPSFH